MVLRNQILHGDCIELMRRLPDQSVELVFADPPYNLQLQHELRRPNQSMVDAVDDTWDQFGDFAEYDAFTRAWLGECRRVLKDTGTIWVIGSYHNIYRVGTILLDLGYWILNDVVWAKTNPMPNFRGTRFTNATETLIWAQKIKGQRYTFNYQSMKRFNEDKQMTNVWQIPICSGKERLKIDGKKAHSTQKPEALLYRVILSSSNTGDTVLDPFFGSGTTGAVAKKLKRGFIGIEREASYIEVARQRIAAIPEPDVATELLETPSRRSLPSVPFGRLLEVGYIGIGQRLFSKDRAIVAQVKADATLILEGDGFVGSIHRAAAYVQGLNSANGWDYWHLDNGHSLDSLRHDYRRVYLSDGTTATAAIQ